MASTGLTWALWALNSHVSWGFSGIQADFMGFDEIYDKRDTMINLKHLAVFEDWGSTAFQCQKCQWIFWSAQPAGFWDVFAPERGDPVPCFRLSYVTPSDGYDLAAQRLRKAWGTIFRHKRWWLCWLRRSLEVLHLEISRDADSLMWGTYCLYLFVSVWSSVWFSQMRIVIWLVVSKILKIFYFIDGIILSFIIFYPSHWDPFFSAG